MGSEEVDEFVKTKVPSEPIGAVAKKEPPTPRPDEQVTEI
jgi:hypothetical protein